MRDGIPATHGARPRGGGLVRAGAALALQAALAAGGPAAHAADLALQPFAGPGDTPRAPWTVVGLPHQSKPYTRFSVVELDGRRALRIEARSSYGNLVHPLHREVMAPRLAWRWRVDEPNPAADLHVREGDDTAIKVCALWDLPLERVPFVERQVLRFARTRSDVELPAAVVCYVWDARLAPGTRLASAFTRRVRYVVLRGAGEPLARWAAESRDIGADFRELFGDESPTLPPLAGIAVGADADNTRGHSLAHAADITLAEP